MENYWKTQIKTAHNWKDWKFRDLVFGVIVPTIVAFLIVGIAMSSSVAAIALKIHSVGSHCRGCSAHADWVGLEPMGRWSIRIPDGQSLHAVFCRSSLCFSRKWRHKLIGQLGQRHVDRVCCWSIKQAFR